MKFDEAMDSGLRMRRAWLPDRHGYDIDVWGPYPGSVSEGSMVAAEFICVLLKIGVDFGESKRINVAKKRCL